MFLTLQVMLTRAPLRRPPRSRVCSCGAELERDPAALQRALPGPCTALGPRPLHQAQGLLLAGFLFYLLMNVRTLPRLKLLFLLTLLD